jgi:two-component system response regulator MtrA
MQPQVLVIEDDESIVEIIKLVLKGEGFEVIAFNSCVGLQEKLTSANTDDLSIKPNLIIMDINLPIISGSDFCKYLKATPDINQVPVILMSANLNIKDIQIECEADDSISKPFNIKKLVTKVKQNLLLV